jgi:drug/metabolite transporter (DMT)-like permease
VNPPAVAGPGRPAAWATLLLWVVPALWSSNYVIARLAQGVVGPHALALGRWTIALALMLPVVAAVLWRQRAAIAREWPQMLLLGTLGMAICGAWVYIGAATTSATNIALIYAATPVAIAVAGVKLLHERMSTAQRVAVVAALAGVLFVIARGDPRNLLAVRFVPGDAWLLGCAVAWTAYSVLLKRWPSALSPAARLAAIIAGGVLVLLPFTVAEALWWQPPPLSWPALGLMLAGGVMPGVLSYVAYSYLQREIGAARSALLLYLAPVYGALGAWWLLGEVPGWYHAAGAALILPSIWLATRAPAGGAR